MRATGTSHALQMALTGERISAAQALACGLVSEITPRDQLLPRALQIAQRIAANAPLAVQAVKKLSRQTPHLGEREAQELTELHWGVLRDTQDRLEGRAAFAEKRAPIYRGR
jgi:enoyl-CoA hydratase/carnithine racemase